MSNSISNNKTLSLKCRELQNTYPDVLEKWRKFGDPLQKMMVEIIDRNADQGIKS